MILQALSLTLRLAVLVSVILMAIGLLAGIVALSMEIRGRSHCFASHRIAADSAWFLCAHCDWSAQSIGTLVSLHYRRESRIHLSGTRSRIDTLQLAICGATHCGFLRVSGPQTARSVLHAWRFPLAHVLENRIPSGFPRCVDWVCLELCAHVG